jgi:sulfatase modifying factor 1
VDNEVQHEVRLSRGFWLADTACTQALWQAVTAPTRATSRTTRATRSRTSAGTTCRLPQRTEPALPGLQARLPSEAEWEYACRAGTTTPFSFGDNITPEQVNYDGNYPYAGGEKGLYRQKTVPAGSLPAKPWGLYEMHGNVWEWCADWYGDYPTAPQVDPTGPQTGASRVLRGGSWDLPARQEPGDRARCRLKAAAEPAGRVSEKSLAEPGYRNGNRGRTTSGSGAKSSKP